MASPLLCAIDVGTGSVRAALIDIRGNIEALAARAIEQHTPRPDWSEQSPQAWWAGVQACLLEVTAQADPSRVAAIAVCGQMHGTVPLSASGELLLKRVQLWNDKRAGEQARATAARYDVRRLAQLTGNPPAPSWIGFKLAWMRDHQPEVYDAAAIVLTPKDFVVFELTGEVATDLSEASGSFLLDHRLAAYSSELESILGVSAAKLPAVRPSAEVVGRVSTKAAAITGLRDGTPVVTGGGDFPVAMLGSGITGPGQGSDITGTSTLISLWTPKPIIHPGLMNLHGVDDGWVAFTMIDAGGDSMRWARRLLNDAAHPFAEIERAAAEVPAGAEGLIFLPYLNGERLGDHPNARALFFGATQRHGKAAFHRAVMEGVALASRRNLETLRKAGAEPTQIVAAGGGAKGRLWLEIKAAVYRVPILVPETPESGLLGCAALAGIGAGIFAGTDEAVSSLVRHERPILPDPRLVDRYARMAGIFDDLYTAAGAFYDRLDDLDRGQERT